ncbi:sporulation protein YqfD [Clostridium sp. CF011]|uniref:sporulation protein YqfD n=2 Tax=unclassified Clostridium TaxID=2614128 RepID=UPI001C0C6B87|nr:MULTISPECIES: sporulation protein YqfD [unclassified Clostridium]MBU3090723.1 sporulation protein YqfD [Clostridium sp. CF011]MBW9144283.1 sporulation protein YqfD [Clostridium sp. CM027]UVE41082.1 sporulation protein YqfD [Clostridium sp. CM027]WAG70074.1 sporulation protein YqfD [Clostridium sp. CF011]
MKVMNNFKKYKKGNITMEIQSLMPEKFINLLWRNGIQVKNIKKINITTVVLEVRLSDYGEISKVAKRTDTRVKIIVRSGAAFFLIKLRSRSALLLGVILFGSVIYYLSTFVWNIEINTENYISPYELRQQIKGFGIRPGLKKKNIDVYDIENKITRSNDEIMWVKARIDGVKLKVDVIERQSPPIIISNQTPCNLVASKHGMVVRVYTTEGTAVVEAGKMIQKGELLVKGEQGKEENVYPVHAKGEVIAKTFYEEIKEVPLNNISKVKTGNSISNLYIKFANKKIYLKNNIIPYSNYDKIENNSKFIKKEIYYEIEEKNIPADEGKVVEGMYSNILKNLDKSVKIIDKIKDVKKEKDKYLIRVVVVAEENIASEGEITPEKVSIPEKK